MTDELDLPTRFNFKFDFNVKPDIEKDYIKLHVSKSLLTLIGVVILALFVAGRKRR